MGPFNSSHIKKSWGISKRDWKIPSKKVKIVFWGVENIIMSKSESEKHP